MNNEYPENQRSPAVNYSSTSTSPEGKKKSGRGCLAVMGDLAGTFFMALFRFFLKGLALIFVWQVCNLLLLLSLILMVTLAATAVGGMVNGDNVRMSFNQRLTKKTLYSTVDELEESGDNLIVELYLNGPIMEDSAPDNELFEEANPIAEFKKDLDRLLEDRDEKVKGILVRVNSPGGAVSTSDRLYEKLRRVQSELNVPIWAFYEDVAASGAVYITASSNMILAEPTCITGSVGVIMSQTVLKDLFKKIGVDMSAYTSGKYKDMGSPARGATDRERELFEGMVKEMYDRFATIVDEGRGDRMSREQIDSLQGQFFLAPKGKEVGLVDETCYLDDCYRKFRESVPELADAKIVRFKRAPGFQQFFRHLEGEMILFFKRLHSSAFVPLPSYL